MKSLKIILFCIIYSTMLKTYEHELECNKHFKFEIMKIFHNYKKQFFLKTGPFLWTGSWFHIYLRYLHIIIIISTYDQYAYCYWLVGKKLQLVFKTIKISQKYSKIPWITTTKYISYKNVRVNFVWKIILMA